MHTDATASSQHLTFFLGGEEYAIGILKVREVLEYDTITKVPGVPACVRGVINLRGSVVPVVDLAVKFGLPACEVTRRTCIVIVEVPGREDGLAVMGVMADAVSQVVTFAASDVEPAPDFGTRVRVDFLRGMGRMGKKFALLLDTDRLLTTDELLSATTAAATAEPAAEEESALPIEAPPSPVEAEASSPIEGPS